MNNIKSLRWRRIFSADNRAVVIAMDHGVFGASPLGNLREPDKLIAQVVAAGADAILTTPGIVAAFGSAFGRAGLILRVDGGTTRLGGNWGQMSQMFSVSDALRLGAYAVVAMGFIGGAEEKASLASLAAVARECLEWRVPLLAEMMLMGEAREKQTPENLSTAARIGAEMGADWIKIAYTGSPESFKFLVEDCFAPVLMLGGDSKAEAEILGQVKDAMNAGAAGVAMGRNVWQHPDPAGMTRAIVDIVHGK
jgi:DhnA family fructose-bisphosphate aldolase class Ia